MHRVWNCRLSPTEAPGRWATTRKHWLHSPLPRSMTNPPADFRLQRGDDAVVVAEGLGDLRPLELQHA